jgi:S-adenosylmethionine:diacylglycerol 3-amino-3-carboxypropyl transferase
MSAFKRDLLDHSLLILFEKAQVKSFRERRLTLTRILVYKDESVEMIVKLSSSFASIMTRHYEKVAGFFVNPTRLKFFGFEMSDLVSIVRARTLQVS